MDEWTNCQQGKMESSCSTFVPLVVNAVFFSDCCVNFARFLYIIVYFGMFHKCNVRNCASSAKSFVIVFDDCSDVLEKTMRVTVRSLPKKNGVPVKINVILLRFPQANLFLAKIILLDFTGVFRCDRAPRSCYQ